MRSMVEGCRRSRSLSRRTVTPLRQACGLPPPLAGFLCKAPASTILAKAGIQLRGDYKCLSSLPNWTPASAGVVDVHGRRPDFRRGILAGEESPLAGIAPLAPHAYLNAMATSISEIALTPAAASRVAAIAERQNKPAILRLSVEGGGCSGFQYKFGLADGPAEDDVIAETDGVRLVVDSISLDLVRGAEVDYVESLGGAAFRVTNPNAASGCGCGTSFAV
ncbi:iron-sulfur cluster assembly accessory protein [Sphingomonas sp. SORGH_AS 879]|nr:iron-sulfur cluster assembly accessory protein [Sphingomonas sp. SORGH_AS_0879]